MLRYALDYYYFFFFIGFLKPFFLISVLRSVGCSNPVWGLTKNPHDKDRTPGGSSGGEGALVSAHGSPFGITLAILNYSNMIKTR